MINCHLSIPLRAGSVRSCKKWKGSNMGIILASKSPRRQELLRKLGVDFSILTEDVDERMDPGLPPQEEVARVSALKAAAVLPQVAPDDLVLCADTIVVLDGQVMGKPKDEDDAFAMLRRLSGRTHTVYTAVTVCRGSRQTTVCEATDVTFRPLSDREIRAYIATGDPMDKAGAYGVQGGASCFVSGLCGDYYNVMGLPLCRVATLLRSYGIAILEEDQNP